MSADGRIRHDGAGHRFELEQDGQAAFLEYEQDGDRLAITHTVVPEAIGGRGIAGRLVQAVMEHARQAGLKVVPRCSYAAAWARKHPEFADILA